ncbi:hypothetical protein GCM10023189_00880 [Nibrella saemangeumensis]|uniref:Tetratricopeptide repeat-containing protein n=1 Tax=Nibrella saemangeumensis TaxID=1084526 RepID=A0ABP8MA38_9BACT
MTHLLIFLFLSLWQHRSIDQISRHNLARKSAEAAYKNADFSQAAKQYAFLNRSTGDAAVRINLAHSYFHLQQYQQARQQYEALLQEEDAYLASMAALQLGVIACFERDSATALAFFRQALLKDPESEPARYNFELIEKRYSGVPPKKQASKEEKQAAKQQTSLQSQSGQAVERSEKEDEKLKRFSELNMTEEEALKLLDALQGQDLPYSSLRPFRGGRSAGSSAARNKNRW